MSPIFLSNEGGNRWTIVENPLSDFMEYSRYFQRIYPSHTISETKKVLNSSTQAKLSLRSSRFSSKHRQGASSATLSSDYITRPVTCTCAALQQSSSTEEQQAHSSSREAEEHLSGMHVA